MRQLYAYDFDKTIVSYDTFRRYLLHLFLLRPMSIGRILLLRKIRLISGSDLKERVTKIVEREEVLRQDAQAYANQITHDMHWPVIVPKDAQVLIITASPKVYMQYVAEKLGCDLICSDYKAGIYVEMYGEEKYKSLLLSYPQSEYEYTYAASDSESDICWMREFKQYKLLEVE